ncbi:MAG TPA: hypothetical protein VE690_18105 [Rhodopila sp.]|nr:hypothetical protein [Rhodopila sp.]
MGFHCFSLPAAAPDRCCASANCRPGADVNGTQIAARDGAAMQDEDVLRITAVEDAEIVLVETANL